MSRHKNIKALVKDSYYDEEDPYGDEDGYEGQSYKPSKKAKAAMQ